MIGLRTVRGRGSITSGVTLVITSMVLKKVGYVPIVAKSSKHTFNQDYPSCNCDGTTFALACYDTLQLIRFKLYVGI